MSFPLPTGMILREGTLRVDCFFHRIEPPFCSLQFSHISNAITPTLYRTHVKIEILLIKSFDSVAAHGELPIELFIFPYSHVG